MQISDAQARLIRLLAERFEVLELGIEHPSSYMTRLEVAIEDARGEYVTCAVLEIAVLRGSLAGAMHG